MRKKILCVLTVLFFGLMLGGTLFHEKIDSLFRKHVEVVTPQPYEEMDYYLLIPASAVQYNMVYVLETVEVPYGSYEVVRLKGVEIAGEIDGSVKVKWGIKEKDRVVAVFDESLKNGDRVIGAVKISN